jgi:Peptidase A4 family
VAGPARWVVVAALALAAAVAFLGAPAHGALLSSNWSGYIESGGSFTVATASFNVPNLTASPGRTVTSEWVGVDGSSFTDRSLIQAGVTETYEPSDGLVHFHAWWEILPAVSKPVSLDVRAGDRVAVSITKLGGDEWRIEIRDETRGGSFTATKRYDGPGTSADWIVEAPTDVVDGLDTLGHYVPAVTFQEVGIGGTPGRLHPLTMYQGGVPVSRVSRLLRNGFSVAYRAP